MVGKLKAPKFIHRNGWNTHMEKPPFSEWKFKMINRLKLFSNFIACPFPQTSLDFNDEFGLSRGYCLVFHGFILIDVSILYFFQLNTIAS